MKPLYYFNVKPAAMIESFDEEELLKKKERAKDASTPFFFGSPQSAGGQQI